MSQPAPPTAPPESPPPSHRIDLRRGSVFMFGSMLCFTLNALLLKHFAAHLPQITPWLAMTFRFVIGLGITAVMFTPGGVLKLRRSFQSRLMASRGILGALGTAAYYTSVGPLGAGKATLIGNTWCVFAAIIAAFVLSEKLQPSKVAGICLTFIGLGCLTGISPWSLAEAGYWEIVALVGAVLAALVIVVIRELTKTESSATIFASQCIWGLMLSVPLMLREPMALSSTDIAFVSLAAICAALGQLAMTEGFRFLTVAAGGAFQMTIPLVISLASVGLFGEHFSLLQILGAGAILGGSFLTVVGLRGLGRRSVAK